MFSLNPIFLSVKAGLNCKRTGAINFESDINTNVKIDSFYVERMEPGGWNNL